MNSPRIPLLVAALAAILVLLVLWRTGGISLPGSPEKPLRQGEQEQESPAAVSFPEPGRGNTVLLVSLDGFRGDYLGSDGTPRLHSLLGEAAWTRELIPPFPSLTFPSHLTLATGRPASGHGIPSNKFFDETRGEELRFPGDPALLRAEPLWTTAARQGLRVLSYDWPLSHAQGGPHATEYFEEFFDRELEDSERIERVLGLWERDPRRGDGDPPLRLLTAYAKEADSVAHRRGPGAPETRRAIAGTDDLVAGTIARARGIFDATREGNEQLYLVFAADHGMSPVTRRVNIEALLGEDLAGRLRIVISGNLANIHLIEPGASDAGKTLAAVDEAFAGVPRARIFPPENLPTSWSYGPPDRIGDRVVALGAGYSFDRSSPRPVSPVPPEGGRGLRGMHGYDPEAVPEMAGMLFVLRHPDPLERPGDLGRVESLQLHATLCKVLGIEPARGADERVF